MIYLILLAVGGIHNFFKLKKIFGLQKARGDELANESGGLMTAFIMGAIFKGGILCIIYYLVFG